MRKFAHIINPFDAPTGSHWRLAREVTFASIIRAKKEAEGKVVVNLLSAQFTRDRVLVPTEFTPTLDLDRDVTNVAGFKSPRPLPLLQDILNRLASNVESEYLIYSNTDIAVMPSFYIAIDELINQGYDAIVINRRCISNKFTSVDQLDLMYSELGTMHTGYDTFVIHRSLVEKINLKNLCVGIPMVDTGLIHHLYAFANKFRLCTEKHLTFHLGEELIRDWGDAEYINHNRREFLSILRELKPHLNISNIPGANLPFFSRHFKWLMNPTFDYPTMFSLDFAQWNRPRRKRIPKEVSGFRQRWATWMIAKVNFRDRDLE